MSDTNHYAGAAGVDLAHAVTVFVTTVGATTFPACMAHLRAQDCRFRLQVIDHVAPMHVAFQRVMDARETPYYAQVDEDGDGNKIAVEKSRGVEPPGAPPIATGTPARAPSVPARRDGRRRL